MKTSISVSYGLDSPHLAFSTALLAVHRHPTRAINSVVASGDGEIATQACGRKSLFP